MRGIFFLLSQIDELIRRNRFCFGTGESFCPESEIGYLSAAYEDCTPAICRGNYRPAREGIRKGYGNYTLLTILGEALIRSGITPGQPEFSEAKLCWEKAVAIQPMTRILKSL